MSNEYVLENLKLFYERSQFITSSTGTERLQLIYNSVSQFLPDNSLILICMRNLIYTIRTCMNGISIEDIPTRYLNLYTQYRTEIEVYIQRLESSMQRQVSSNVYPIGLDSSGSVSGPVSVSGSSGSVSGSSKRQNFKFKDSCPICIEQYVDGDDLSLTICGHIFHKMCLESVTITRCPICRKSLEFGSSSRSKRSRSRSKRSRSRSKKSLLKSMKF